ncbi:ROK family transcriptional regulator [Dactylosporangium maewongense]
MMADGPVEPVGFDATAVADRGSSRRTNLGLILRLLRDHGARSRSQIASDTGLPKATVTSLITELVERGLVREGKVDRGKAIGRPSHEIEMDGRNICGVGLEVNADYISAVALDGHGTVVFETRAGVDVRGLSAEVAVGVLERVARQGLEAVRANGVEPIGMCVATPGVVDAVQGNVVFAPNIGWRDVPLAAMLRQRLTTSAPRLQVENDARLAAVAEHAEFAQRGVSELLLITGEVGVAGGIISNGRPLRGYAGLAGEIGHTRFGSSDQPCVCGRTGCWETVVGLSALLNRATSPGDPVRDPATDLEERLSELLQRAADGDQRARTALDEVAVNLGDGLAVLADILNPEIIVLGGYFAFFGDFFVPSVQQRLDSRVMTPALPGTTVTRSRLGFTAACRGGAQLALEAVLQDPSLVTAPAMAGNL